MRQRLIAASLLSACITVARAQSVPPDLLDLYKDLHAHPKLSRHEERTSSIVADALGKDGYTVTDHIGIYLKVLDNESTPALYNDPDLMGRVRTTPQSTLGNDNVVNSPRKMGSEDVGVFGLKPGAGGIPVAYFWLGAMDPEKLAAARAKGTLPPGVHTSKFEPLPEPTLTTGINAMTAVAESLLQ